MPKRKQATKANDIGSNTNNEKEFLTEEEYRKKFEPVAPWKWTNIPDYGPLQDQQHWFIFFLVGAVMTFVFEFTHFFDQIDRRLGYILIWCPLWFHLLGRLGPQELTEEEIEEKERLAFQKELEKIAKEAELDEE